MVRELSILVVDDDIDNAKSLGELFEMEGHVVRVVHSGQAAIDAYVKQSFDIAFMDVMMPGKNGVESFFEIRSMRPQAKVFMMTGYSVEELLQQAVRGGALGVLEKPYDSAEVLKLTQNVGPGGLVVSASADARPDVGQFIHDALRNGGLASQLWQSDDINSNRLAPHEVLVINANIPLIDEVSLYSRLKTSGHDAQTIIVPPIKLPAPITGNFLRNVDVTGVLNKPFDPEDLLRRLPQLVA
jgi:two-component system, NtrC family, response regulator HydG